VKAVPFAEPSARFVQAALVGASRAFCAVAERRGAPRLSILAFHRVLEQADPMFPDLLDQARFEALMGVVAKAFVVLPLGEAASRLKAGTLPPRALSVTFDDGYADNATVAMPALRHLGLSATFFVATGYLDGGWMFNDRIIESVRRADERRLDLRDLGLQQRREVSIGERRRVADELILRAKYLQGTERDAFVTDLERRFGGVQHKRSLMLTSSQVIDLHRAGMEIGGHTISHPILRCIPNAQAEAEIAGGRLALERLIGAPVEVFAYPNGQPGQDYDERHVEIIRRLGFRAAVSTASGTATAASSLFELPRFTPWDRSRLMWIMRLLRARVEADPTWMNGHALSAG
jgi:peptidoglycan/xylan/chitin deacetylase (PgdA/CDA1 family)